MEQHGRLLYKYILVALILILGLALFLLRKRLAAVFIPLIVSVLLAYMLEPAVSFVQKHNRFLKCKKRNKAVMIVFFSFLILFAGAIAFILPTLISNVADIMESLDEIQPRLSSYIRNMISDNHSGLRENVLSVIDSFAEQIKLKLSDASQAAASFSTYGKITGVIVGIITSLVLTYYFLRDKTLILNGVLGLFPYSWRKHVTETACELGMISAKFIQGQVFVALIVGAIEAVGLILLRIPYGIFFGLIGGLSNMIPYFGPFFGAVLPVIAALMISPSKALWVLILFLGVQQLDNHFISPKIIQGNLGIHPITVIILVFIGQEFLGLWGIVTIVPVYAMTKCLFVRGIKFIAGYSLRLSSLEQKNRPKQVE